MVIPLLPGDMSLQKDNLYVKLFQNTCLGGINQRDYWSIGEGF